MAPAAYARAYQRQSILTASSGQLVLMLYDGVLRFLAQARQGFRLPEDDYTRIEQINEGLQRAQAIITELQINLDHGAGGDVAGNLDRLYDYYSRRLLEANLRKQEEPVEEVERLVGQLRDGWAEMLRKQEHARAV